MLVKWTNTGFVKVFEGGSIRFRVDKIPRSMSYQFHLRYQPKVKAEKHNRKFFRPYNILRPLKNLLFNFFVLMSLLLNKDLEQILSSGKLSIKAFFRFDF